MSLSCVMARPSTGFLGGENLTGVFSGEGSIAIADLSNPRDLSFQHEGSSIPCGWAYTAKVVQSLSGDAERFDFVVTAAEEPLPLGRYLVFVDRVQADAAKISTEQPRSVESDLAARREECWQQLSYFTHPDLEMIFPVIPESHDEKIRGPITGRSMLEVLDVKPCGTDEHGSVFCLDDVREGVSAVTGVGEVPAWD